MDYISHPAWERLGIPEDGGWTADIGGCYWGEGRLEYLTRSAQPHISGRRLMDGWIINIFILIMDQMTMCNVKGVTHSDKPTDNQHLTLQLPLVQNVLVPFSSLF